MVNIEDILHFWFADAPTLPAAAAERNKFWFEASDEFDRTIWSMFADSVSDAAAGLYDVWADTAAGRLTLILLLDQFPRNMYRGTAEVFRYDTRALAFAREGVEKDHLAELSIPEQAFFLMPYQHSEDLATQKEGVELYRTMAALADDEWRELAEGYRDFAILHHDIIERFGRFPHRNAVLGRSPTPAEERYLAAGGETFGQSGE